MVEQYKIMVETSEKQMDRRQSVVNLYVTLCVALLALFGASFSFGSLLVSFVLSLVVGAIPILLTWNWSKTLKGYGNSNYWKLEVINAIERNLPADMFDCEYKINTLNGKKSYSNNGMTLPLVFFIVGILGLITGIVGGFSLLLWCDWNVGRKFIIDNFVRKIISFVLTFLFDKRIL